MAVNTAQVVGERHKYSSLCYHVYQPTGAGDWFRWRLITYGQYINGGEGTYFGVSGVARGQVYAGHQDVAAAPDASSGFATSEGRFGVTRIATTTYADYLQFDAPSGKNKLKIIRCTQSNWGVAKISFRDAGGAELSNTTYSCIGSTGVMETSWVDVPSGTVTVRVSKNVNNSDSVNLVGIDWLDTSSAVDPDTAGSVMYAGEDITGSEVMPHPWWNTYMFDTGPQTPSTIISWVDNGGAYAATVEVGSVGHRGVDTSTTTWKYQVDGDAIADWTASQGDRVVCDYFVVDQSAFIYKEAACTNRRGTLTTRNIFDASGWVQDWSCAVDQGTNMDMWTLYSAMCPLPITVNKYYVSGDETVRSITGAIAPDLKTHKVELWGGESGTHYTIEQINLDTDAAFFQLAYPSKLPSLAAPGGYYKQYFKRYDSATTKVDVDSGSAAVRSRFAVRLRDRKLTQKRLVRIL